MRSQLAAVTEKLAAAQSERGEFRLQVDLQLRRASELAADAEQTRARAQQLDAKRQELEAELVAIRASQQATEQIRDQVTQLLQAVATKPGQRVVKTPRSGPPAF